MLSPAARAPIEPGILPVCNALNACVGVRTVWSCEGHPWRLVPSKPYVIFTAPQSFSFQLHQQLLPAYDDGRLTFSWELHARFQDDGNLIYWLSPNDWRRRITKQELLRLALLIETKCT